jgi:phosphate transport system permease protein
MVHWLRFKDRFFIAAIWFSAIIIAAVFFWILGDLFRHGIGKLSLSFITDAPQNAGRSGGIGTILVSTGLILFVCMAVSLPVGLFTAIFLAEFTKDDNPFGRLVRRSLDMLAGVPSIVFGLFGNVFFCKILGLGFSIVSGGLTLACMVLPLLIRSTEEGFRAVPSSYRFGAAALGITRSSTIFRILLPVAIPGLLVGFVMSVGRAVAETAALIFTSGYVDRMPTSLMDSGRSLSVHIFDLSMNISGGDSNAYSSALVLVILLLIINSASSWMAGAWLKRRIIPV